MAARADRAQFEAFYPTLVKDISAHLKGYGLPQNALDWVENALRHNTANGKLNRGLSVIDTASIILQRHIEPGTQEYTHLATLGWLTELLQAFFLVADDIMDASHTRRGAPCWYRMPNVGMIAINDSFLLESSIYVLLRKYFRQHSSYLDLIELFQEITLKTEAGQLCDLLTAPEDHVDLSNFSADKCRFIMVYKTAYYSFYLPVVLALYYLQIATPKNLKQSQDILVPTGVYFQIQDDYLDVYGSPEQIGKVGTDIQDNKCGWAINEALPLCTAEQRKILDTCYGRKDKAKELEVKKVFEELKLQQRYLDFEEKEVSRIKSLIQQIDESEGLKKDVFESFLAKIYKRSK